jgi:hypothetical protein
LRDGGDGRFILFWVQIGSRKLDHPALPYFGLFVSLWATLLLVFWRQAEATLAYRWGTLNYEVRHAW